MTTREAIAVAALLKEKHCAAERTSTAERRQGSRQIWRKGRLEKSLPSEELEWMLRSEERMAWSPFKAAPLEISGVLQSMQDYWGVPPRNVRSLRGKFVKYQICSLAFSSNGQHLHSAHAWQEWQGRLQKKILNVNTFFFSLAEGNVGCKQWRHRAQTLQTER